MIPNNGLRSAVNNCYIPIWLCIKESCKLYDEPLPEYNISSTGVMVCCKACSRYTALMDKNNSLISDDRTVSELLSGRSGEPNSKIIAFVDKNGSITNAQGQEITGKSAPQVRRYLKELEEAGYIKGSKGTRNKVYTKQ